ncbi:MAG TPA: hypothetical protein GX743_10905 [Actinomycetales bacterium]|nr:hypothetical protein [Actinomycetales bacterium]
MRLRELLREAGRNLASGTSRALTWALLLASVILLTAGIDQAAVTGHRIDHEEFRARGGTYWMVQAPGAIDPIRCEAMTSHSGVAAAGAVRGAGDVRLSLLPSTTTPLREVSPGMRGILHIEGHDGGAWLPESLASTLGLVPGQHLSLASGEAAYVQSVYRQPGGTSSTLSNALVAPIPIAGMWDECWIDLEVYDESVTAAATSYVPVRSADGAGETRMTQLSSALGRSHNLAEVLDTRQTRILQWALPALAALVGFTAARNRRLEYASARHVGVAHTDLAATAMLEALAWATAAGLIATATGSLVHVALYRAAGLDPAPTVLGTLASLAAPAAVAAIAACAAAATTAGLTNPRLLYHYFRQR